MRGTTALLALSVTFLLCGCGEKVPEEWRAMGLPLEHATVREGTKPTRERLLLRYEGLSAGLRLCETFKESVGKAGFDWDRQHRKSRATATAATYVLVGEREQIEIRCDLGKDSLLVGLSRVPVER